MTGLSLETDGLLEYRDGLPDWWLDHGNRLLGPPDASLPQLICPTGLEPPRGNIVRLGLGATRLQKILLWGADNVVELGDWVVIHNGTICCGDGARILIGEKTLIADAAWIDARNGGSICVGREGLWSSGIRVATDDMHAILDAKTGHRINRRGSNIVLDRHIWVGIDAMIMPGATIGADSIIGARSIVSGVVPANVVCAGVPARVVREGVTWSIDDLTPEATGVAV
jgi:acetyltransferase-like isoleucine patch superfamily enzyme